MMECHGGIGGTARRVAAWLASAFFALSFTYIKGLRLIFFPNVGHYTASISTPVFQSSQAIAKDLPDAPYQWERHRRAGEPGNIPSAATLAR